MLRGTRMHGRLFSDELPSAGITGLAAASQSAQLMCARALTANCCRNWASDDCGLSAGPGTSQRDASAARAVGD